MTKIKMCGLSRAEDIEFANAVKPDYIGFVFARASKRYVTPERAAELKKMLSPEIKAVGVFVNETFENIVRLVECGTIDIVQLHGDEPDELILRLQERGISVIRAYTVTSREDITIAENSPADHILLDSGKGSGKTFNWELIRNIGRPYFLAGGITPENAAEAVEKLHPFALDASSSLETDGYKDINKMTALAEAVRMKG